MSDRGGRGGRGRGDRGGFRGGRGGDRGGRGGGRGGHQSSSAAFDMTALAKIAGETSSQQNRGGRGGRGARGARGGRGRGRGRPERTENYDVVTTRPSNFEKTGTSGQQVDLLTNYLGFSKCPEKCLFKYRVDFKANVSGELETFTKKKLFSRLSAKLPPFLFDGSMLYLPAKVKELKHTSSLESGQAVPIELRLISELHPTDNDYVHFYNMIKQSAIEKLGLKQMKRDFYDPGGVINKQEWNIALWPGYKTTIRQHENEMLLGVEITHKMLRTDSAWGTISAIQARYGNGPECIRQIKRALIGSIVISHYNNKTYRIDDVDFTTTPASTFDKKDGSKISFKDYYKERYNISVRNVNQPMLISMPKDKDKRRGDLQAVKIIPELTHMTGITDEQRANYQMMNALSEWTRMVPHKRVESIQKFAQRLNSKKEVVDELERWGMQLNPSIKTLKGRLLPPEKVYLKTEVSYPSTNADWGNRLRDGMMEHKVIPKIAIVVARQIIQQGKFYWDKMKRIAPSLNIQLGEPKWFEVPDARVTSYTSIIQGTVANLGPDICICMIPKVDGEMYAALKKVMCCSDKPMLSQVITAQKILNRDKQAESTATKILIQMATKLGARPWLVKIPPKDVMVAGYDAQKNKDRGGKSFGAFAASMDKDFGRYYSRAIFHEGHEEICSFLGQMTTEALKNYQKHNGKFPSRILFYRDGVGEGQLEEVRENEIKAIKNKLGDLDIKLTFIVVSKRINTRFFQKSGDKVNNPCSGTVVDTVVTLPERYDFFLISQSVGQGTVNPTNYNVILDESGWPPDRIQMLTYKLTHLYYNWPGTIRVPAPCMYAHKLADLLGAHLKQNVNEKLTDLSVLYYL